MMLFMWFLMYRRNIQSTGLRDKKEERRNEEILSYQHGEG